MSRITKADEQMAQRITLILVVALLAAAPVLAVRWLWIRTGLLGVVPLGVVGGGVVAFVVKPRISGRRFEKRQRKRSARYVGIVGERLGDPTSRENRRRGSSVSELETELGVPDGRNRPSNDLSLDDALMTHRQRIAESAEESP